MFFYLLPITIISIHLLRKVSQVFDQTITKLFYLLQATVFFWLDNFVASLIQANDRAPRAGDKTISVKWLNRLLHEKNLINSDSNVVNVEINDLEANRGLISIINVIKITYDNDIEQLKSLILKTNRIDSLKARLRNAAIGSAREAIFLDRFSTSLSNYMPKVYYSHASIITGSYVIVMENLKGRTTGVNFYFGNQIWGMPLTPLERPREQELMLRDIYLKAAEMHAKYWNDKSLLNKRWLKGVPWHHGDDQALWTLGLKSTKKLWNKAKKESIFVEGSGENQVKWSSKLISIIDKSIENTTWYKLQEHLHDPKIPFTLTHGDFHASNMLYRNKPDNDMDDNSLIWLDWSEVGIWEPMADIGQIIISDMRPEIRRKCEKKLVKEYWDRLVSLGVSEIEYPFEQCWKSYQILPVERWIWMFVILSSLNLPTKAIQYFHDQLLAFIEDHSTQPYYILKPIQFFQA